MRLLLFAVGLCALAGLGAGLPIHDQRLFVTNAMVRPVGRWTDSISAQHCRHLKADATGLSL